MGRCVDAEARRSNRKRGKSLFIFHTEIKLPQWLGKAIFFFGNCSQKNPPNTQKKGGRVGCRGVNRAALSQFMGQNKTAKKKKKKNITDSGTARLYRSISDVKQLSDISSFFLLMYCLSA